MEGPDENKFKEEHMNGETFIVCYKGLTEDLKDPKFNKKYLNTDKWFYSKEIKRSFAERSYGILLHSNPVNALMDGKRVFRTLVKKPKRETDRSFIKMINPLSRELRAYGFFLTSDEIDFNEVWKTTKNTMLSYKLCGSDSNFDPHRFWDELNDFHVLNICSSNNKNFKPMSVFDELSVGQVNNLCYSMNPNFYPHDVWDKLTNEQITILCAMGNENFFPNQVWNELNNIQKEYVIRSAQKNFRVKSAMFDMKMRNVFKALMNKGKRKIKNKLSKWNYLKTYSY